MATRCLKTPKELGYRMPAEFEKHEATWLAWPNTKFANYWHHNLEAVQSTSLQIIKALEESEKVYLLVADTDMQNEVRKNAKQKNTNLEHVIFYEIPTYDIWTRDYGPIFIVREKDRKLAITHWLFNGWGNKYPDLVQDTFVPSRINEIENSTYFNAGIILEGGSIEVNGKGTLLTTRQCLLNKNRNPYLNQQKIENRLEHYLGVKRIIWLENGIITDDTDGHVDNIARFVSERRIVMPFEEDERDENYSILQENYKRMQNEKDQNNQGFKVFKLPTPGYIEGRQGRLTASYANFYIANTTVLVPTFGRIEKDKKALTIIKKLFPKRKVKGINCRQLLEGGGAIHCITQQQPK